MARPTSTILAKLLLAYVAPTLALFALFAYFAYDLMRRDLDAELGRRLEAIAGVAATRIRPQYLVDTDNQSKVYERAQTDLKDLAQYRCLYQKVRLAYSATLITEPKPNEPPAKKKP